jgi:hypothetical protein
MAGNIALQKKKQITGNEKPVKGVFEFSSYSIVIDIVLV